MMRAVFSATSGVVEEFDDNVGLGRVRDVDGHLWSFHCTAIGDGSRHIDPGTQVRFEVVPGRQGLYEAIALEPA